MVVKTMTSQIHNSPKHANVPIIMDHHGVSTLMSQNHEITKLHRCYRITRSQNCTYSNVIVGTTMTLSNNKFRSLMVISPTMSMHQIGCNVIVNVSRLQRWLQQLQIHLAPNWSISAQNIRTPFRDEWRWINPRLIELSTSSCIHIMHKHPRMIAPIDEVQRCSHARMKVDIVLQHRLP